MTTNNSANAVIPPTSGRSNASATPPATPPATPGTIAPSKSAEGGGPNGTSMLTTGVIVPLYSYPGSDWDIVVRAKQVNPSVPVVVTINPSNGPGGSQDQNYVSGVEKLRSAGIIVLGYVHTSYAARSSSSVIADIDSYKAWYAVNGIFFDEMSNVPGNEAYYSSLSTYAKSIGLSFTFGNPGASVPASYVGTVDCIVVYESQGLPNSSSLGAWTMGMAKNNFAMIAYGVVQLNNSSMSNLSDHVAYVYITDNSLPNPYGALPGYFASIVAAMDTTYPNSVVLSVQSASLTGTPITDLRTEITSNGSVVASGYTPITRPVPSGMQYTVSVANYGTYVFDHWDDGSTNPVRTVTPTQQTTLVAYFRHTSALTVRSVSLHEALPSSTISGAPAVQISYTNNNNDTFTAIVLGVVHNPAGQTTCYTTATISPAAG